jgi:DNA-binding NarL/FixJ family response regulator
VSRRTTVLIVDDHQVLVEGLLALLGDYPDLEVVGTASNGAEAIEAVDARPPDVVLMDYRMPDVDGAVATATIHSRHPGVAVVFLSGDNSEAALFAAVEAGAVGYLVKSEAMSQVANAVRWAAQGEMLLPKDVLSSLIQHQRQRSLDERHRERLRESMTSRELDVLRLMAAGLDNQQVADRLFISYLTVRGHVRNILDKLDCHTKLAAVARASEYGLIPVPPLSEVHE